jgi:hypothetical protein
MFGQSAVVAFEIDLGVVCLVDASCRCFAFASLLVFTHEFLSIALLFSCMGILLSPWLLFVSGLGHRFRVIRSWRVLLVHLRRVHSQPYFVCSGVGPVTIFMLKTVWIGAEWILWYWRMM